MFMFAFLNILDSLLENVSWYVSVMSVCVSSVFVLFTVVTELDRKYHKLYVRLARGQNKLDHL